jgi:hypothetical protein
MDYRSSGISLRPPSLATDLQHAEPGSHHLAYLLGLGTDSPVTPDDNEAPRRDRRDPIRIENPQRTLWDQRMTNVNGVGTGDR